LKAVNRGQGCFYRTSAWRNGHESLSTGPMTDVANPRNAACRRRRAEGTAEMEEQGYPTTRAQLPCRSHRRGSVFWLRSVSSNQEPSVTMTSPSPLRLLFGPKYLVYTGPQ